MSYSSLSFLVFAAITCFLYFVIPQKYRWTVLLAASYVFYAINSKLLTVFIIISTAVLYFTGNLIQKQNEQFSAAKSELPKEERKTLKAKTNKKKRLILTFGVILNVSMLLVIKYSGFFVSTADSLISLFNKDFALNTISFTLPLGISYYTLSGISYMTDVYRGTVKAEKNPLKLSLFLVFFPTIVEGPFLRYGEISKTLYSGARFNYDRFVGGITRVLWGLIKKLIIADRAGFLVDAVFSDAANYGGANILLAAMTYTFQIYAEFSGCMDIVLGISEILGIEMPENFRQPFFSKSIDEFWRRWHITLGAWLRDYIFYPVSLSKNSKKLNSFCRDKLGGYYGSLIPAMYALFFVWFMNGFWHGASWKYVFYGLYYYILMMLGKLLKPVFDKLKINRDSKAFSMFAILRTNIIVLFGMLIFRAHSLKDAFGLIGRIFTDFSLKPFSDGSIIRYENFTFYDFIVLIAGFAAIVTISVLKENKIAVRKNILYKSIALRWVILFVMIFSLIIFGVYGGNVVSTFIYGQF